MSRKVLLKKRMPGWATRTQSERKVRAESLGDRKKGGLGERGGGVAEQKGENGIKCTNKP